MSFVTLVLLAIAALFYAGVAVLVVSMCIVAARTDADDARMMDALDADTAA